MEKPYLLGWLSRFHSIFKDTISTPAFVLPQNDLPSRCGLMAVDRSVLRVMYLVRGLGRVVLPQGELRSRST